MLVVYVNICILRKMDIMNICILLGTIIEEIEFKFAFGGRHNSITRFKLKLENGTILKAKAYDKIADTCYRKLEKDNVVIMQGKLNGKLEILVNNIFVIK